MKRRRINKSYKWKPHRFGRSSDTIKLSGVGEVNDRESLLGSSGNLYISTKIIGVNKKSYKLYLRDADLDIYIL